MVYVIRNNFHNWFYIGINFFSSVRAKKHYSEKFSLDKKFILLSEYHAAEIEEKGKNLGEEIIILPIIIFPSLFSLDTETKLILENLMKRIEFRLVYACKQAGYQLSNDPVPLSPNAPKAEKELLKVTIENVKNYCLERVSNLKCIPFPFETILANAKKVLFYNVRNQFARKVPPFFENEIYKKWFITLEFWIDLEEKYSIEKLREILLNTANYKKKTTFSKEQKKFQSLLLEKYLAVNSNIDESSNTEAISDPQETLDINSNLNDSECFENSLELQGFKDGKPSKSEIEKLKKYVMEKVEKKSVFLLIFIPV